MSLWRFELRTLTLKSSNMHFATRLTRVLSNGDRLKLYKLILKSSNMHASPAWFQGRPSTGMLEIQVRLQLPLVV